MPWHLMACSKQASGDVSGVLILQAIIVRWRGNSFSSTNSWAHVNGMCEANAVDLCENENAYSVVVKANVLKGTRTEPSPTRLSSVHALGNAMLRSLVWVTVMRVLAK